MSSELNVGADWEQSKRLVIHWHNRWAKSELEKQFILEYLNPADTSFRQLVHNFMGLTKEQKQKLIDLAEVLARPTPTPEAE